MNELRSPLEDRPYRPAARAERVEVMSTGDFYRNKWLAIRYSRWFPMASVIAGIALFGVIVSYAYREGTQVGDNATTPVIQADGTEYKEKPADPGGMDVPFQDAVVFDQLQSANTAKAGEGEKVENLLAPPEQPVAATTEAPAKAETPADATAPAANDNAKAEVKDTEAAPVATTESKVEAATEATTPPAVAPAVEETVVKPVAEAKPANEAKPVAETPVVMEKPQEKTQEKTMTMDAIVNETVAPKEAAPAAMPAAAPVATTPMATQGGEWRVQLGSFRDEAAAKAAWSKFQQKHPAELGSLSAQFPRADIPGKGVFYRVQGTNLAKDSATAICKQLNAEMPSSCIVTK